MIVKCQYCRKPFDVRAADYDLAFSFAHVFQTVTKWICESCLKRKRLPACVVIPIQIMNRTEKNGR